MEDDLNGRRPQRKTTSMEDDLNGRRPGWLWDGTGPSTTLQVLGNQYCDLDSGELRPPDKSGILSCGTEVGNN